jgi:hypothetical protein
VSELTPPEIDGRLAELYYEHYELDARRDKTIERLHEAVGDHQVDWRGDRIKAARYGAPRERGARWSMDLGDVLKVDPETVKLMYRHSFEFLVGQYGETIARLAELDAEMAPLDALYNARQWNRFFLVPGGHIHRDMHCQTCNRGQSPTRFAWLPEQSGLTEPDAVAAHGPLLCTVCYPSAPTEWTNGLDKPKGCQGSGTYDYDRSTARMGYVHGNYGTCSHCNGRIALTKTSKLRAHQPKTEGPNPK